MINLKNGYGIVSDGKSYTLVQDAIQKSKDGVETEIKKQISFHSTLEGALQGYSPKYQFKNINSLTEMRKNGYFKCINRDETIEEILEKSEVVL